MDEDDYRALLFLVEQRLAEVGAEELADPSRYLARRLGAVGDEDAVFPLEPAERLVEMLKAFDRHMKVQDRSTYVVALERINGRLEEGRVEAAVVVPAPGDESRGLIALESAPDLGDIRVRLSSFLGQLREIYRPGGASL